MFESFLPLNIKRSQTKPWFSFHRIETIGPLDQVGCFIWGDGMAHHKSAIKSAINPTCNPYPISLSPSCHLSRISTYATCEGPVPTSSPMRCRSRSWTEALRFTIHTILGILRRNEREDNEQLVACMGKEGSSYDLSSFSRFSRLWCFSWFYHHKRCFLTMKKVIH